MADKKFSYSRVERWDMAVVDRLLTELPVDHHDRPTLQSVKGRANEHGEIQVDYYYAKGLEIGRSYAVHAYQNVTQETRKRCANGYYHDYDMVNAYGEILLQVFKLRRIECPPLEEYVKNREQLFAEILTAAPCLNRKDIKKAFIVAMHGGCYRKHATDGLQVNALSRFTGGVRHAVGKLKVHPDYAAIFKQSQESSRKTYTDLGRFVSFVCQIEEARVVECFFRDIQGPNAFDGQMSHLAMDQAELDRRTRVVFEETGLNLPFIEKSMEYTPEPLLREEPVLPGDQWICFDLDGTLGHSAGSHYTFRPGVERLRELADKGFKLAMFTNKFNKNIPLDQLEQLAGVRFGIVIGGEHCYKPTAQYIKNHPTLDEYDRLKPLAKFFPLDQVILVDDTPAKVHPTERHRCKAISTWKAGPDQGLHSLIDTFQFANVTHAVDLFEGQSSKWKQGVTIHEWDDEWVRPIEFNTRLQAIVAGCGKGKTTVAQQYIEKLNSEFMAERGFPIRVLDMTARRTLSQAHLGVYQKVGGVEFIHYSARNYTADCLVVQYESLCTLVGVPEFDLVIIDELRELVGCMTSVLTNHSNLKLNFDMFKLFAKYTPRVLALCADMEVDGACAHVLQSVFQPHEMTIHKYTKPRLVKHMQCTDDESGWVHRISNALMAGEKVAIACRSKARAKILGRMFAAYKPFVLTAESGDDAAKRIRDLNIALADEQLFVFSATLTVGADHTTEWDRVFIDGSGRFGAPPRSLMQMMARFRMCKSDDVHVLMSTEQEMADVPTAFTQALDMVNLKKGFFKESVAYYHFDLQYNEYGEMESAPDDLTQLFAYTYAERFRGWGYELQRQALTKGFKITVTADRSVCADIKKVKKMVKEEDQAVHKAAFDELSQASDMTDVIKEKKKLVRNQSASHLDKTVLSGAHVLKHYEVGLDEKQLAFAIAHQKQICNYAAYIRLTKENLLRKDFNKALNLAYPDLQHDNRYLQYQTVEDVFTAIGYTGCEFFSMAQPEWVPEAVFQTPEVLELVLKIPVERRPESTDAKAMFSACLKSIFGSRLETERRGRSRAKFYRLAHNPEICKLVGESDYFANAELKDILFQPIRPARVGAPKRKEPEPEDGMPPAFAEEPAAKKPKKKALRKAKPPVLPFTTAQLDARRSVGMTCQSQPLLSFS